MEFHYKYFIYFCFLLFSLLFYNCRESNKDIVKKQIPNSVSIKKFNNSSVLIREVICVKGTVQYESKVQNDTIIEYNLIRTDTIISKDSIGDMEVLHPVYSKKAIFKGKIILEDLEGSNNDKIDVCDCIIGCR